MANDTVRNRAQYLAWLRTNFPDLYADIMAGVADNVREASLSGFFDSVGTAFSSVLNNVTKALPSLAQTYSQYEAQKKLLQVNTSRASQGLAPLQYDTQGRLITAGGLPYTAEDYQLALHGGTSGLDSTTLLLIGGAVLLLVLVLRR